MMKRNCQKCNKEFSKPANESKAVWASGRHKFCSKKCHYGERATLVCKECGGYFNVKNYRKEIAQFCSKICSEQNRNEGKYSENYRIRRSASYRAWRTLVFVRDDYTCQSCGVRGGSLHADHIKPFALYPELRLEVSNGRALCVPCHKKTPTYGNSSLYRKQCVAVA